MWKYTPAEDEKEIITVRDLEDLLDKPLANPQPIPYSLIHFITSGSEKGIGSGGYGDVHLGILENGKKVAVKEIVYSTQDIDEVLRQETSCFLKARHHPNIARLVGYSADKSSRMVLDTFGQNSFTETPKRYLCLEYAPSGDLHDHIEESDEVNWRTYYQIIMGICEGLEHIHKQQIVHLDIKPKNILLDGYLRPKITDFGVSVYLPEIDGEVKDFPGTTGFKAPELRTSSDVTYKCDIYSLGATIGRLLMRNNSEDVEKWLEENRNDKNSPKEKTSFIDIARNCMKHDPNERNTLEETIKQLKGMGLEDLKIDDSEEVLKVVPHEMQFQQFDPEKVTLSLVNPTGHRVAFRMCLPKEEITGTRIIEPRSTHSFDMRMDESGTLLVQSIVTSKNINIGEIPSNIFEINVPGRRVYEVEVKISVVEATNKLSPVIPGSYNGSLDVQPRELCFDFVPNKTMTCSLQLTNNDTNNMVVFRIIKDKSFNYNWMTHGIVLPMSACTVVFIKKGKEKLPAKLPQKKSARRSAIIPESSLLILQTIICDYDVSFDNAMECNDFFKQSEEHVDSVPLKVVYGTEGESTSQLSHSVPGSIKIISVTDTNDDRGSLGMHSVKYLRAHPTMPWAVLGRGRSSTVEIWNYETQRRIGSLVVGKEEDTSYKIEGLLLPTFIKREGWLVITDNGGRAHVYSYERNMEKIDSFRIDDIPAAWLAVHPDKPYLLSACPMSGEMKLWDWGKNWRLKQTFVPKYSAPVSQVVFNPDDPNSFASASKDCTVKLWNLRSPRCYHTLMGHRKLVSCLDFFKTGGKQYLITGSYDMTAKIWELENMTCIRTLEEFMSPVVCVFAHPNLPLLITGTKNGVVHVWNSSNFRVQRIFNISSRGQILSLALACSIGSTSIVIGQQYAISIMDFVDEDDIKMEGEKELETLMCGEPEARGESSGDAMVANYKEEARDKEESLSSNNNDDTSRQRKKKHHDTDDGNETSNEGTDKKGPTYVPSINEIDELLCKVDTLMKKVPTTGERLSRISRIFPPGRGPRAEAVMEVINYDAAVLEGLKKANLYIRDSIVKLGKTQDAICREFEREAVMIERQRKQRDGTVVFAAVEEASDTRVASYYKIEAKDTGESLYSYNDNDIDDNNEASEEGTENDNVNSACERGSHTG